MTSASSTCGTSRRRSPAWCAARFGSGPTGLTYDGHLVPALDAGGGAYGLTLGADVQWFASLDAGATPVLLGSRPSARCNEPETVVLAGGDLLVSDGPTRWCVADTVEVMRAGAGGVLRLASHPKPDAWSHQLLPRVGGAWLAVTYDLRIEVTPLDEQGAVDGPTWVGDKWNASVVVPWGSGFALAEYGGVEGASGVELRVSDGEHVTSLAPLEGDAYGSDGGIGLVASADGRSLLVAHEQVFGHVVQVRRVECVSR